jgi:hypothetical protein
MPFSSAKPLKTQLHAVLISNHRRRSWYTATASITCRAGREYTPAASQYTGIYGIFGLQQRTYHLKILKLYLDLATLCIFPAPNHMMDRCRALERLIVQVEQ